MGELQRFTDATPALASLAEEINTEYRATRWHAENAVRHGIRTGELLVEAKAQVRHGEWYPWLAKNFEGTPRHAQNFMKLYRQQKRLRLSESDSLRAALLELSAPEITDEQYAKWLRDFNEMVRLTKKTTPRAVAIRAKAKLSDEELKEFYELMVKGEAWLRGFVAKMEETLAEQTEQR